MRLLYEPLTDIPVGFTEVEYIQSNGTQYIDVGLKANGNTGLDIVFSNSITSDLPVLGSRTSWSSNAFSINWANGKYAFNYGNYALSQNLTTNVSIDTNKHTASIRSGGVCKFDSWSYTFGDYTFTTPNNITLFALDNNGTIIFTQANINIYMCKIYNGNVLVRDFVPCLDNNNVPCMYDKVEGKAYYNAGTGTFSYGRQIIPVEYLESTGTQYIDTGFMPNQDTKIDLIGKFATNYPTCLYATRWTQSPTYDTYGCYAESANLYTYYGRFSDNQFIGVNISEFDYRNTYINFVQDKNVATYTLLDGSDTWTYTFNTAIFQSTRSLTLFYFSSASTFNTKGGTIKSCKLYDNGTLIRDYIPCRDENSVGFMFDKATHTIYDNAGTGSFLVGPIKKKKKLRLIYDWNNRVPRGFKEVEYIQSSGTQYINTGFIPTGNTGIDMRFLITGRGSGGNDSNMIMVGGDSAGYRCGFGYRSSSDTTYGHTLQVSGICATGNSWENYAMTINVPHIVLYNYDNQKKCYLDGVLVRENIPYGTATVTYPLFIFSSNMNGTSWRTSSFKLYYCKIVDNGVLVRDYIPCLDSNNVPCLWDTVTKQAYYNQGTGDFTYGNQIIPVKYLESTGTQYIDTGISTWNNTLEYEVKLGVKQQSGVRTYFGCYDSWGAGGKIVPSLNTFVQNYKMQSNFNTGFVAASGTPIGIENGQTGIISLKGNTLSWSEGSSLTFDRGDAFTKNNLPILLFGTWYSNGPKELASFPMYYAKIWLDNVLVRDYIPVRDEDNIGYMFDRVTHTLYGNVGTGSFVVGEQLKNTIRLIEEEIPSIYERVNYLKASAQQYIDTGIMGKSGVRSSVGFEWDESDIGQDRYILAAADGYYGRCYFGTYQSKWMYGYSSYWQYGTPEANTRYDAEVSWELGNQYMKINGETLYTGTMTSLLNTTWTMYMFARNQGGASWFSAAKIYYCKIWEDGVLVRNYVPVVRKSDNKPGMYDRVTKQFYTNKREDIEDFTWG